MASYNKTVLVQQPDLLQKCLTISLGNNAEMDPIEYYNSNSDSLTKFFRSSISEDFKISKDDFEGLDEGFNIIYYIDTAGNLIAYTKYNENLHYSKADVIIKTNFKIAIENDTTALSDQLIQDTNKVGVERYSYTSGESIKNYKESGMPTFLGTYNTSVESTLRDGSCIFNRDSIVRSGLLEHLDFSSGFFMKDAIQEGFSKYDIAAYKGGIALYAWREKEDCFDVRIVSLSKQNLFGDPILLTKKSLGYVKIPYKDLDVNRILYFAGKYAVLNKTNNQAILFNLETETVDNIDSSKFFIDLYDKTCKVVSLNEGDLGNIFPELNDLEPLSNIFIKKGNWVITKTGKYYGPYFNYTVNDDNIIVVNDRTLLACENNTWKLVRGEEDGFEIDLNNIYQSPLQYFRRNSFYSGKIKTIIAAYKGIIYYMTDNGEIKYL